MELNKVLERVRKLIDQAEHPNTGAEEAQKFRAKADQMMLDYAIEQADLDATRPAEQRTTPETLKIDLIRSGSPVRYEIVKIAGYLADHCRLRIVIHNFFDDEFIENWGRSSFFDEYNTGATLVGYASDLRYFELMWTVVQLHFSGAVDPRPDASLSFDENCYRMHEAGITYRKMVQMLFKEELTNFTAEKEIRKYGGRCKAAYKRECVKRGEEPRAIPNPDIYQKSFAKAYANRVFWRLQDMKGSQSGGRTTALVLRTETVDEKFRELFPDLGTIDVEKDDGKRDAQGWIAGYQAGGEVDLSGQRMGASESANRPELG